MGSCIAKSVGWLSMDWKELDSTPGEDSDFLLIILTSSMALGPPSLQSDRYQELHRGKGGWCVVQTSFSVQG